MGNFSNYKFVKTRKPHKCGFCGTVIPAKQLVEYGSGICDDQWFSCYLCNFCNKWIKGIKPDLSDGFSEEFLSEHLNQIGYTLVDINHINKTIDIEINEKTYTIYWDELIDKCKKDISGYV